MGILDFLSAEKREARRLGRIVKRANNKYTPKDYRQVALQEMIDEARRGNAIALSGLLARFAVCAEPSIEDEEEKEWVHDALVEIGPPALPYIRRALRSAESVVWVQRVFKSIVTPEEYKGELLDVLLGFDTEYERNPDRKMQTVMALAEVPGHDVAEALLRFLTDVDETVRFQTVVALARHADEVAREPLLKAICDDESIRVRNIAIESFANLGWVTTGFKKKTESLLPAGYTQDKSGRIIKIGSP
ncbi:MAG: HEAT repeat domain-containing protein [Deltaproteobacteria bacterium]|nr:HEAT repeat domain-containing protein [Deltaproteobacteria bacterium]